MGGPRGWAPLAAALALAGCAGGAEPDRAAAELTVFAAASLREVATELGTEFSRESGRRVQFNFAGSNALAQQILAADGADVFLSADRDWTERVVAAGRGTAGSERAVFGNRLVVVAREDAALSLAEPAQLATADYRFLALADPDGVPAGRYTRRRLEALAHAGGSLWQAVSERAVPTLDVRAALALVESDPLIVGVVYRTDAATSPRVRELFELPPLAGDPIAYWAVPLASSRAPEAARAFVEFLLSPRGAEVARRHGFTEAP